MFFSGGGVTFTGGEATLWHEELLTVLKELKARGINTAIETNGTDKDLIELSPYVDYLMMDVKHFDRERLKEVCGGDLSRIANNISNLLAEREQLHLRIPLIGGFNSADPAGFVRFFEGFDTGRAVFEFLPYHEYGKDKWQGKYTFENGFISRETLNNFKKHFTDAGLRLTES
jgi:pyruvate formate lyase activating enzyme